MPLGLILISGILWLKPFYSFYSFSLKIHFIFHPTTNSPSVGLSAKSNIGFTEEVGFDWATERKWMKFY